MCVCYGCESDAAVRRAVVRMRGMVQLQAGLSGAITVARVAYMLVFGYLALRLRGPFLTREQRDVLVGQWCRDMLGVLGIKLSPAGGLPAQGEARGMLVVANHVSWVDTLAIRAMVPCGFLAKASLQGWPIIGPLIALSGGVFVQRGNPFDLQRALADMREALEAGRSICVFPEGTTTDGTSVGPFTTLVFELAVRHRVAVVPVGVRYLQHGIPTRVPAWVGDEAFLPSLLRIATAPGLEVCVVTGDRLGETDQRLHAAEAARHAIAALLRVPLAPEPTPATLAVVPGPVDPRAAEIDEAVRRWIADYRKLPVRDVADHATLRSLGVDSLALLDMILALEARLALRLDESRLDLTARATVVELVAAMVRCEVASAGELPARVTMPV